MELKSIGRRKLKRAWRHVRKPAGVLKLPRPVKKKVKGKKRTEDSREELDRILRESLRKNDALMRALS